MLLAEVWTQQSDGLKTKLKTSAGRTKEAKKKEAMEKEAKQKEATDRVLLPVPTFGTGLPSVGVTPLS